MRFRTPKPRPTPPRTPATFVSALRKMNGGSRDIAFLLAEYAEVPYCENWELSPEGQPNCSEGLEAAVQLVSVLSGVYFHYRSRCVVLVSETGLKIAIQSDDLTVFGELRRGAVDKLAPFFTVPLT